MEVFQFFSERSLKLWQFDVYHLCSRRLRYLHKCRNVLQTGHHKIHGHNFLLAQFRRRNSCKQRHSNRSKREHYTFVVGSKLGQKYRKLCIGRPGRGSHLGIPRCTGTHLFAHFYFVRSRALFINKV